VGFEPTVEFPLHTLSKRAEREGAPVGRALTPEEQKRLFEAAASNPEWEHVYCAAVLAANTSMRGVEVKHVRRKDVDLEKVWDVESATINMDVGALRKVLKRYGHWRRLQDHVSMLSRRQRWNSKCSARRRSPSHRFGHQRMRRFVGRVSRS